MSNRKRLMLEIAVAVLLLLICAAVWTSSRRSGEQRLAQLETRHESAVEQIRQECEARAEELATSEAQAVFRAFAAGIQGSVLGQQKGMLDMAKGGLLRLPHVAFVHVLTPDGKVLTTSNEKYAVAGSADARASWALQASDLQTRPGDLPGTIEIAAPFQGASGRVAVLWLGYKTQELLRATPQDAEPEG
ncbi:MAG TPA: hypothetical protein VLQ45_02640 [Thermoanaerobaculia bacterium]|nr:hypothetical protein [Thermoanaerobaculia bacterium]